MKSICYIFIIMFMIVAEPSMVIAQSTEKLKVILDADLDSDVDDVGALAMLLNLHNEGTIELIGVIITSDDPYAPVCAAAISAFYGQPGIPVGFLKKQPKLNNHSKYTRQLAAEFPSGLKSWQDAEEAVTLYRRLLAGSPDETVVIVTVGHLTSLQGVMQSRADEISPLTGDELVSRKVQKWFCMGGQFPSGKEANFYRPDPGSTVYCVKNWKKEVVFCGWEAGNKVITGGAWLKESLIPHHPVYRGYELYNNFAGRQSWDQLAVLQLTETGRNFFLLRTGTCMVAPDGSNTWQDNPKGKHQHIVINPAVDIKRITHYTDRLMAGK